MNILEALTRIEFNLLQLHLSTRKSEKGNAQMLESMILIREIKEIINGRSDNSENQAAENPSPNLVFLQ